ncbi:atrial natriuretic peptide receptor 3 [Polistes fuscatus]|uniref:atrial natriuretic peptide receptor 3 n=1 Tax=Polistes fuscatus TaxID=30207 RepID=UPI001CA9AB33|nr:atrial natriuretic peptide receptor 3 [Polistes fuscatus]
MLQTAIGKSTCREIELPRDCEALCNTSRTGVVSCELRVVVMLPADPQYEIALPKVLPVLDLAVYNARAQNLLPHWLNLTFLFEDDRCDATYAQRGAIDSYSNCVHLFLGPTCDYCVANVGRVVKFFGAPLITTGGLTFDFTVPKKECKDEYFMTTRVGTVSFRDISKFFIEIMNYHEWRKVHLLYATNGQRQVAGRHTCQLMMKSLVEFIRMEPDFIYGNFDFETTMPEDYLETLKVHVGNSYGVYKIPCECDKWTNKNRNSKKRLDQHRNDCKPTNVQKTNTTALAEHHFNTGHKFKFDKATILDREDNWYKRNISEMYLITNNNTDITIEDIIILRVSRLLNTSLDGISSV